MEKGKRWKKKEEEKEAFAGPEGIVTGGFMAWLNPAVFGRLMGRLAVAYKGCLCKVWEYAGCEKW